MASTTFALRTHRSCRGDNRQYPGALCHHRRARRGNAACRAHALGSAPLRVVGPLVLGLLDQDEDDTPRVREPRHPTRATSAMPETRNSQKGVVAIIGTRCADRPIAHVAAEMRTTYSASIRHSDGIHWGRYSANTRANQGDWAYPRRTGPLASGSAPVRVRECSKQPRRGDDPGFEARTGPAWLPNDPAPCRSAGSHWRRSDEKVIQSSRGCERFHLMQLATLNRR